MLSFVLVKKWREWKYLLGEIRPLQFMECSLWNCNVEAEYERVFDCLGGKCSEKDEMF